MCHRSYIISPSALTKLESLKEKQEWGEKGRQKRVEKKYTNLHNVCHTWTRDLVTWMQPSSGGFAHECSTSTRIPLHSAELEFIQSAFFAHADGRLQLWAGDWMGAAHGASRTGGCSRRRCTRTWAAGAAWARSPTHLQLRHSQVLDGRGKTLDS